MKFNREIYASGDSERNDCSVRAFATATGLSYRTSHKLFEKHGRKSGRRTPYRVTDKVIKERFPNAAYENNLSLTLRKFVELNNKGRFIVHVEGHALAVVNGVIHDWKERPRTKIREVWRLV